MVIFRALGCQHDHGKICRARICAEFPEDTDPVLFREHDIQEQKGRDPLLQLFVKSRRNCESCRAVSLTFQCISNQLTYAVIIFQNIDHLSFPFGPSPE